MKQELRILILVAAAFGIGLVVLVTHPDYRIPQNLASNQDYYPVAGAPPLPDTRQPESRLFTPALPDSDSIHTDSPPAFRPDNTEDSDPDQPFVPDMFPDREFDF